MTRTFSTATTLASRSSPQPWQPHAYQLKAVRFALQHQHALLLLDPGLGKTSIVLAALKVLKQRKLNRGTLVVAPRRVARSVWTGEEGEPTVWTDFHCLSVGLLHGSQKERVLGEKHDIYVTTPDTLPWLTEKRVWRALQSRLTGLVIDETSKFKHTTRGRFSRLKPLLSHFERRWGLGASPAPNGLLDLYGQVYVVDQGAALGPFFSHYRAKYFVPGGYGHYTWLPAQDAEDSIYRKLRQVALRMDAEDYLTLPQLVTNVIRVELDGRARQLYDTVEQELFAQVDAHRISAPSVGAAISKCHQIANGAVYVDAQQRLVDEQPGYRTVLVVHDEKIEALLDLIDELSGSPILVAVSYKHDVERLRRALEHEVPYYGGGISDRDAHALERQWNAGELPVLLCHPGSVGHGLNLQKGPAQHIAWFSMTFDYDHYDQLIRRLRRQGSAHSRIFNHLLVAKNTTDEARLLALRRKGSAQTSFLNALRDYRRGERGKRNTLNS